jgi:hypothetical protein
MTGLLLEPWTPHPRPCWHWRLPLHRVDNDNSRTHHAPAIVLEPYVPRCFRYHISARDAHQFHRLLPARLLPGVF